MLLKTDEKFESYLCFCFEIGEKLECWYLGPEKGVVLCMKCWGDEDLRWLGRWWKDFE